MIIEHVLWSHCLIPLRPAKRRHLWWLPSADGAAESICQSQWLYCIYDIITYHNSSLLCDREHSGHFHWTQWHALMVETTSAQFDCLLHTCCGCLLNMDWFECFCNYCNYCVLHVSYSFSVLQQCSFPMWDHPTSITSIYHIPSCQSQSRIMSLSLERY